MTDQLTVAVVIPTHNRRDLLMKTLDSLAEQSRPPDSVVVVADGCEDDTVEAVEARHDAVVIATPGVGAAGARNAGWQSMDADVVAFIDDDCWAEPQWLAGLTSRFDAPDIGLVQGQTLPEGDVGPFDRTVRVVRQTGLYESCNIAYRRSALAEVGGMREGFGRDFGSRTGAPGQGGGSGFGEDTDLAWRVLRTGWQAVFEEKAVVRHAVFPGTPTSMLAEAWRTRLFPFLVNEIPELRDLLPGGRWLFRRQSAVAQLATLGIAGALIGRRAAPAFLAVPYLAWLSRQTHQPSTAARIAARDAVTSVALVAGSIRHRSLLL